MKKYISFLSMFSLLALMLISSCDKIKPPYIKHTTVPDTGNVRTFLLEEFTGHHCTNCPAGSAMAEQLKAIYGNRLIIISIHYGGFATPDPYGQFHQDLRDSTGNDIGSTFNVQAYPSGMISRVGWSPVLNNAVLLKDQWGPTIDSIVTLAQSPLFSIEFSNLSYNASSHTVNASLEYDALQSLNGVYMSSAYITEDSIVGAQETTTGTISNYVFRYVLRGAMNGTWGDTLANGNISNGAQFHKGYSMALDTTWNVNHCHVVAFVYNKSNYEIMQVVDKKVK